MDECIHVHIGTEKEYKCDNKFGNKGGKRTGDDDTPVREHQKQENKQG